MNKLKFFGYLFLASLSLTIFASYFYRPDISIERWIITGLTFLGFFWLTLDEYKQKPKHCYFYNKLCIGNLCSVTNDPKTCRHLIKPNLENG